MALQTRTKAVRERIAQMTSVYGERDERVKYLKENVLKPLLEGEDRMKQVKEGTAAKLSDTETTHQKLDILKTDVYLGATAAAEQMQLLEKGINTLGKRIDILTKKRLELAGLLENMETAYAAVDQFEDATEKNLTNLNKSNETAVDTLGKQYDYLTKAKAADPGLGTSIWNTALVGKWGVMGLVRVSTECRVMSVTRVQN